MILLNSLPTQFDVLKDVIKYERDDLTVNKLTEAVI